MYFPGPSTKVASWGQGKACAVWDGTCTTSPVLIDCRCLRCCYNTLEDSISWRTSEV